MPIAPSNFNGAGAILRTDRGSSGSADAVSQDTSAPDDLRDIVEDGVDEVHGDMAMDHDSANLDAALAFIKNMDVRQAALAGMNFAVGPARAGTGLAAGSGALAALGVARSHDVG